MRQLREPRAAMISKGLYRSLVLGKTCVLIQASPSGDSADVLSIGFYRHEVSVAKESIAEFLISAEEIAKDKETVTYEVPVCGS